MSSRRTRSRAGQPPISRITDQQLADLAAQLWQLLPENHRNRLPNTVSASEVLQETCNYISSLRREVDDLSERLLRLLSTMDGDSDEAAIIRRFLERD